MIVFVYTRENDHGLLVGLCLTLIFAAIQNVRFPYCKENQVNGDYTRTRAKKLSLLYKVTAKVPFTHLLGR